MFRSADAYIRELSGNPSDVRADVGIRAPILSLSQQPLVSSEWGTLNGDRSRPGCGSARPRAEHCCARSYHRRRPKTPCVLLAVQSA